MARRFMVYWEPINKPDEKYISLIPEEIKAAEKLKEKGSIIGDWISSDRSKGWLLMSGESDAEVIQALKTLPLYDFLKLEITELFVP